MFLELFAASKERLRRSDMNERHLPEEYSMIRETDRWLRRFAIIGPIVTYMIGSMSGFVAAAWIFKDHERRICVLESWHKEHDLEDKKHEAKAESFEAVVKDRLKIRNP
jgi:hypothetical protein